jgi:hypothetical protein
LCLAIYSDGKVTYFHKWNSGEVRIDAKTGRKSLLERTVSVESQLTRAELFEISRFLESEVVKAIGASFVIPYSHIDYSESAKVHIFGPDGDERTISINGYAVAGLEQKSQLPGALIVLMDKIEEIEKTAALKGKGAQFPLDCPEARK